LFVRPKFRANGLRVGGILGFTSNTNYPTAIRNSSFTGLLICEGDTASMVGGIAGLVRSMSIANVRGCGTVIAPTAVWGSIAGQINGGDNADFTASYADGSYASASPRARSALHSAIEKD